MNRRFWRHNYALAISLGGLIGGIYLLTIALWPSVSQLSPIQARTQQSIYRKLNNPIVPNGDRLYIPSIGVDVAIVEGANASSLSKGAWHRQPQNGNPAIGGNFVLSAHRFQLGATPQGTLKRSPFYAINKLNPGDKLWVDFHGSRYQYIVQRRYTVKPTQTDIESATSVAKLTLYSCTLRGSFDGREVIEALPVPR
jgi:LPXTG-site transpeptidase (sortase) family protein